MQADLPDKLISGAEAEASVSVLSASGKRVPDVSVALDIAGADAPATVNTGSGTAKFKLTANDPAAGVTVTAKAASLPADLPDLYVPTKGESARSGQRLVAPASAAPKVTVKAAVHAQPALATEISSQTSAPGSAITDTIHVTGLGSLPATIEAALYGPYASRDAIKCDGTPVWTGTVQATGDGDYTTEPFTLAAPGYYTYRESIAESDTIEGVQTACADTAETTIAPAAPTVATTVSAAETAPGAQITDSLVVSGLGSFPATVNVELWGPFATRDAIACTGHAGLDGHGGRARRRHVHDGAVHADQRRLLRLPRVDRRL